MKQTFEDALHSHILEKPDEYRIVGTRFYEEVREITL